MRNRDAMPQARQDFPSSERMEWEISPLALERWMPNLQAAAAAPAVDNTISMLDPIGFNPFTGGEGVTSKRVAAALRTIGAEKDVVVNLNSPGGNAMEGLAIYNLLRDHKGKVTVRVLGIAASAASVIAMAGDEILIARAAFMMVHNSFALVGGNRLDLAAAIAMLEPLDTVMCDVYSARSGVDQKKVQKMMDAETFINGTAAIDQGFADGLLPADAVKQGAKAEHVLPAHQIDVLLARVGLPRSERRALMQEFKTGTRDAAGAGTRGAAEEDDTPSAVGAELVAALQSFSVSP